MMDMETAQSWAFLVIVAALVILCLWFGWFISGGGDR